MLELNGVHESDRTVLLDAHDFSFFTNNSVDFMTFDKTCYDGAKNVKML